MTKLFNTYNTWIFSNSANAGHTAMIALRNSSGILVCTVYFLRTGSILPINQIRPNGEIIIYYTESWYREVLHLIQTEKPLFVFIDELSFRACIATTEQEPVGEQEGV